MANRIEDNAIQDLQYSHTIMRRVAMMIVRQIMSQFMQALPHPSNQHLVEAAMPIRVAHRTLALVFCRMHYEDMVSSRSRRGSKAVSALEHDREKSGVDAKTVTGSLYF